MNNLFNYNNKFFQGINKIADCFFLSVLWVVFSIPVITAGASSTAAYYTVNKVIKGNRGYVWRSFWESFRSNFKQSTLMWLICLAVGGILGADAYITYNMLGNGSKLGFFYYIFLVMIVFFILWMVYLFSYTARFENTIKQTMKNCGIIAIANLPRTFLLLLEIVVFVLIFFFVPVLSIFSPTLLCLAFNLTLEKVYLKYMSPEDIEKEKELEMEAKM
ncbi:MAG: YesL family protein [Roseburia sp.]|nr:YesL family protein [Roseburia sp.]